jgi:hypothetical protein
VIAVNGEDGHCDVVIGVLIVDDAGVGEVDGLIGHDLERDRTIAEHVFAQDRHAAEERLQHSTAQAQTTDRLAFGGASPNRSGAITDLSAGFVVMKQITALQHEIALQ